jgi:2Fe-2S ferredoxin
MPKVIYVEHSGSRHEIEVPVGDSVMRGAVYNGVPGIDADCGGECACATCHVYVDPAWLALAGEPGEMEKSMLSSGANTRDNSRLSCQIRVTEALDGLVVRLPDGQH